MFSTAALCGLGQHNDENTCIARRAPLGVQASANPAPTSGAPDSKHTRPSVNAFIIRHDIFFDIYITSTWTERRREGDGRRESRSTGAKKQHDPVLSLFLLLSFSLSLFLASFSVPRLFLSFLLRSAPRLHRRCPRRRRPRAWAWLRARGAPAFCLCLAICLPAAACSCKRRMAEEIELWTGRICVAAAEAKFASQGCYGPIRAAKRAMGQAKARTQPGPPCGAVGWPVQARNSGLRCRAKQHWHAGLCRSSEICVAGKAGARAYGRRPRAYGGGGRARTHPARAPSRHTPAARLAPRAGGHPGHRVAHRGPGLGPHSKATILLAAWQLPRARPRRRAHSSQACACEQ